MDAVLPQAPAAVAGLYRTLTARGFEVVQQRQGGMGGAVIVLEGVVAVDGDPVPAQVRLSGERGEWSIEFKLEGMPDFQVTWVWRHYLDGDELAPTDPERQAGFVTERLADVARALRADPDAAATVSRLGQNYMRRKLGMPPLENEDGRS